MLNNMTIKNKLIAVVAFLAIALLLGGYMGVHFLSLSNETSNAIYGYVTSSTALSPAQLTEVKSVYEIGQSRYHMVMWLVGVLMIVSIGFAAALAWWLIHAITRPLGAAVAAAERIASGDLSQEIPVTSHDEIGVLMQAMQTMQAGLNEIVTHVRQGTETIASAAHEIAAGNTDLSNRTESQANSLSVTATETAQMTKMVEETTEHAHHAQKVAATTREMCESGGETMAKVVSTMSEISSSSRKIVDIISVIEGIAFQTNILALNAAVEAARAGEQGRGFAVVAGEVRSLAQRSAAAAKEIKTLITESVHKVKDGTQLVEEAGDNMDEILTVVGMFTDLLDSIYEASTQQNTGISTINRSVSEMDETTQQNAALVEQAAAAAQSLQDQAQALEQTVGEFKLSAYQAHVPERMTQRRSASGSSTRKQQSNEIDSVGEEWQEY